MAEIPYKSRKKSMKDLKEEFERQGMNEGADTYKTTYPKEGPVGKKKMKKRYREGFGR